MSVFSRHVDVAVVALNWKRTVVIEQGRWHSHRTAWKPHGDNVRNLRTGDSTADVRWPEYTFEPDQRISERRETYHAKFSADADGDKREYVTELDEATWRTLELGLKCRLKVGGFSDEVKQVTALRP